MNPSNELSELYIRDLKKLKEEVMSYHDEASLWIKSGDIKNSAGNLTMHICGNLQHFIGSVLGGSSYIRDRAFEFEGRMKLDQLIDEINKTIESMNSFFQKAADDTYQADYPIEVFGYKMSTFYFMIHLQGHLNYHLGQVNYHRRILSK